MNKPVGFWNRRPEILKRTEPDKRGPVSLEAAKKIEDIFCAHHSGGRTQRLARIQVVILEAIEEARK